MDITMADIRSWMTVLQMAVFIGIVWWAFGRRRKAEFDEAANLVFEDDDLIPVPGRKPGAGGR
jgi:cytochrome c oxidase cbb3-type subunit 4